MRAKYSTPKLVHRGTMAPMGGESVPTVEIALNLYDLPEEAIRTALVGLGLSSTAPWLVGRCPGCGGSYVLGVKADDPKGRALFHSMPPCERAEALPPLGYLQWVRTEGGRSMQRRGGNLAELR